LYVVPDAPDKTFHWHELSGRVLLQTTAPVPLSLISQLLLSQLVCEKSAKNVQEPSPETCIADKTAEQVGAGLHVSVLVLFKAPSI